jgi:HAMP domain-containing protein
MIGGSLRSRLALLYAGVFLALAVVVLAIPFLAVSETVHVGSSAPPVVRHPGRDLYPQVSTLMISLAVIAAVSLGSGWLLAGRLLRPLRVIVATAQDISATNLSRRLRTGRRDDEFSRLGRTLNDLFARLEASFESQRHFVANAAHELRTPLTAERTVLQVALADPEASVATLRAACDEVLRVGEQQEKWLGRDRDRNGGRAGRPAGQEHRAGDPARRRRPPVPPIPAARGRAGTTRTRAGTTRARWRARARRRVRAWAGHRPCHRRRARRRAQREPAARGRPRHHGGLPGRTRPALTDPPGRPPAGRSAAG